MHVSDESAWLTPISSSTSLPFLSTNHNATSPFNRILFNSSSSETMDPSFLRDSPDLAPLRPSMPSSSSPSSSSSSSPSSSRLQSAGYFSCPLQQRDLRSRHPPTTPTVTGASIPSPPVDAVRKTTPPEEHRIHTDEKLAAAEDPYKQAERYVEECRAWRKPGPAGYLPRPLEDYETPLRIMMSKDDWIKLNQKLNLEKNDDP
jgi:hypothetical protein